MRGCKYASTAFLPRHELDKTIRALGGRSCMDNVDARFQSLQQLHGNARRWCGCTAKAWVTERADQIELLYLPSYSPELNSEVRLNADLKHHTGSKVPARTKAKRKAAATEHMKRLEQSPERVRSHFQDPRVRYAT
jgi:hypothetical protein